MIEFQIKTNDSGKRIDNVLIRLLQNCPKALIYKAFRNKDVKINGKWCKENQIVECGDNIKAFLPNDIVIKEKSKKYDFINASKKLDIVFEDENILICNKPAGLICHSDNKTFGDTLIDRIKRYLYDSKQYIPEEENTFSPALCNRLDRNTCGLVIAAKNYISLNEINKAIKNHEIEKHYYCLVQGVPKIKSDTITSYIERDENNNISKISSFKTEDSKEVITKYTKVKSYKDISLLDINLITGRTHQIRSQMAYLGTPLVGDKKYGGKRNNTFPYQALGAYKLIFNLNQSYKNIDYLNNKVFETNDIWFLKTLD